MVVQRMHVCLSDMKMGNRRWVLESLWRDPGRKVTVLSLWCGKRASFCSIEILSIRIVGAVSMESSKAPDLETISMSGGTAAWWTWGVSSAMSPSTLPGGQHVDNRIIDTFCSGSIRSVTRMLPLSPPLGSLLRLSFSKGTTFRHVSSGIEVTCFVASNCREC